jgi:hypothetical protein
VCYVRRGVDAVDSHRDQTEQEQQHAVHTQCQECCTEAVHAVKE